MDVIIKINTIIIKKSNYDIELTSFKPDGKIKIIKEARTLLSLGLKEAKELIEKSPVTLAKGMKKEDAEALKKKLEELGCSITLK